jgi:hypothetical protein
MENTQSTIPRCLHSVYAPHGVPNSCCSLCTPILVSAKDKTPVVRITKSGWTSKKKAVDIDLDEENLDV